MLQRNKATDHMGAPLQRAIGAARLTLKAVDGKTRLADLYQEGCAKLRFPQGKRAFAETILLNTAGGLTGGDRFSVEMTVEAGARAEITTQACEKIYRSVGGSAEVSTRLVLAQRAECHWLPQETILYDGAGLHRHLTVEMAEDATFLGVEGLIFGRAAFGERIDRLKLNDRISIKRGGRLAYVDAFRFDGAFCPAFARRALGRGAVAAATLLYVASDAEARLEEARALCGDNLCEVGVSAWNGLLAMRFLAPDSTSLRRDIVRILSAWRGIDPPRAWAL